MKKILLTLVCLAMSSVLFAQTYRNGTDNGLNIRSEPSTSATVITSIPPNARVEVIDQSNKEWYKVRYKGETGYVSSKYLSQNNSPNQNGNNKSNNSNRSSAQRNNKSASAASSAYNTGIGFRFGGWESGITVKHFISNSAAIEGILTTGWHYRGSRITGLYEVQKPIAGAPGLSWFYGGGGHLGIYNERYWYNGDCKNGQYEYKGRWYNCDGTRTTLGIDGIIGLEYFFREIPFTIGLDIKPSIDFVGWGSRFGDSAFTARYVF